MKKENRQRLDALVRLTKKLAVIALLTPLKIFPVKKNRVMLNNDLSAAYSDSPKAVAEQMVRARPGQLDIVFAVKDPSAYPEAAAKGIRFVRSNSPRYFYETMTSQVFLTNSGGISFVPFRKSQYVINTWHGGGAYKKGGVHTYGNTFLFRQDLKLAERKTDVYLSSCRRFTEVVGPSILMPTEKFWEIGLPRNDELLHEDPERRLQLREKLGLREDEKLVLYAPTYRRVDDNPFKDPVAISYGIDCERVCEALRKRFGGVWRFAFRLHPAVTNREMLPNGEYIMDLSSYEDMQELLCAADVMINDFSSSMWDFMLTDRPSFMFAVDLEHYVATTDVYTPVSEWPFPKAVNNDELERNILEFDEEKYAAACKRHYEALGGCETGKATQLLCERIYERCFLKIRTGDAHHEHSIGFGRRNWPQDGEK